MDKNISIRFTHGLGDCVNFANLIKLYIDRGYSCNIQYDKNKEGVFKAIGISSCENSDTINHGWCHRGEFNRPNLMYDGMNNKIFGNIGMSPLPYIGNPNEIWNELCGLKIDASCLILEEAEKETDKFLENCSLPIILLHTTGTTSPSEKNIKNEDLVELYKLILDGFSGTLVLLDWDLRVPQLSHCRVRHIRKDWDSISCEQLYCLIKKSQLFVGVDSGPYHFASSLTDIPTIGIFYKYYPSSVIIPKDHTYNSTPNSEYCLSLNSKRRKMWNVGAYNADNPSPKEISEVILRGIDGLRYLRKKNRFGRDMQLQYFVRDLCRQSTDFSQFADRNNTMDILLRETTKRFESPKIVETGCIRQEEDWSAGYSTYIFGAYLDGLETGSLTSIDITPSHCETATRLTEEWKEYINIFCCDSVSWLNDNLENIDVLYLDSMDAYLAGCDIHGLKEVQAAEKNLNKKSLIVFDDTPWDGGYVGKGKLAIPYLLNNGWKIIASGYQVILSRK
jgi:hypothetical protein